MGLKKHYGSPRPNSSEGFFLGSASATIFDAAGAFFYLIRGDIRRNEPRSIGRGLPPGEPQAGGVDFASPEAARELLRAKEAAWHALGRDGRSTSPLASQPSG